MKRLFIIIGNGFSIDFLKEMYQSSTDAKLHSRLDKICLSNLFQQGDCVPSPVDRRNSFLSYCTTPSLWKLGVRPGDNLSESSELIEEISCCANMYLEYANLNKDVKRFSEEPPIHLQAYSELTAYLRALFIWYDSLIDNDEIEAMLNKNEWGWKHTFSKFKQYNAVTIIDYNYDMWLERILDVLSIPYSYPQESYEKGDSRIGAVEIIKPHGSINYISGEEYTDPSRAISYRLDSDIPCLNQLKTVLSVSESINFPGAIVAPGGDATRLYPSSITVQGGDATESESERRESWAQELQDEAKKRAKELSELDSVILCGISYWHADRRELDRLLLSLNGQVRMLVINPHISRDLNATLMCSFPNYMNLASSSEMEERL